MIHFIADMALLLIAVNYHKDFVLALLVIMAIKYTLMFQKGIFSFLCRIYKKIEKPMIHSIADMALLLIAVEYNKELSIALFAIMVIKYFLMFQKVIFCFLYRVYKSDDDFKDLL